MADGKHILFLDGATLPDRRLIGGKAWSIARMRALGLRVPPAFVIATSACAPVLEQGGLPSGLKEEITAAVHWLEEAAGRRFGGAEQPLLVSVRSGAPISMPGMMDTVLNLGVNDGAEAALAAECGDPAFARDTHRRFLELYAGIVLKVPVLLGADEETAAWHRQVEAAGGRIPDNVHDQLLGAIEAVFRSWNSRRARRYREYNRIPDDLGTAVTVQAMVFGNMDDHSGTGVLFSRNPLTGERQPYGEFLPRAQGEDVVSGRHTPEPLQTLARLLPAAHAELLAAAERLETDAGDVQDIEFTIERGTLYLLQTRVAKRAPAAALRIARDMVAEGRITPTDALQRITATQIRTLLNPRLKPGATDGLQPLAEGEAASPGIGVGRVVADSNEAEERAAAGADVVLARATTSPDDLHGMLVARAIITEQGGSTSHAAVVGRALGRPCVVGCGAGSLAGLAGRDVTVDGGSGRIYAGRLPVEVPDAGNDELLAAAAGWAGAAVPIAIGSTAVAGAVDCDSHAERLGSFLSTLPPGATVKGAIFAHSDEAVEQALAAGVSAIVTSPALPAMVAAARHAAQRKPNP